MIIFHIQSRAFQTAPLKSLYYSYESECHKSGCGYSARPGPFSFPGCLAKSIFVEAGELSECFRQNDENYGLRHIKEEPEVVPVCEHDKGKTEPQCR